MSNIHHRITMHPELKLSGLINALSTELKDQILKHVIVATLPRQTTSVGTDTSYTPRWQLSLNRLARRTAAPIYYGTIIFEFGRPETMCGDKPHSAYDMALEWLRSLSPSHRPLVHAIYLPGTMGSQTDLRMLEWKENLRLVRLALRLLASLFARDGMPIAKNVLILARDGDLPWRKRTVNRLRGDKERHFGYSERQGRILILTHGRSATVERGACHHT